MTGGVERTSLRKLFLAARDLEPEAREAFLAEACPDDPALRSEVLELLRAEPIPDQSLDYSGILGADAALDPTPEKREHFGRFALLRPLGSGGMGHVDLAFDPRNQREVAIKRLRPEWVTTTDMIARFEREAMAASRLDVVGLCPIYEVGEVDGTPYFVMPMVQGETLEDRVRGTGAPSQADILWYVRVFEKVARALHHAHEAGFVHRDIKPGNIMIQPNGNPVVLDFGLVQDQQYADSRLTRTGQIPGTPSYMSPEQLSGARTDGRSDVYSLGVSLFECVCGTRPFVGESRLELFEQIKSRPLPAPRKRNRAIPKELVAVLEVATEKDPARRYRTALALAEDLERVRRHQPVQARRMPVWLRLRRWSARNPAAATAVIVLGLCLLGTFLLQRERESLNASLRLTIQTEKALRGTADDLRKTARTRLEDFDALAALHRSRAARETERLLYPAWPDTADALQQWLDEHGSAMRQDADRVASALARLQSRGEANLPAGASPLPNAAALRRELDLLDARIGVLQTAMEVRAGRKPPPSMELPDDAPEAAEELLAAAWPWVDPERGPEQHGKEGRAFAYLVRALGLAEAGPMRSECAYGLLWALVATGADRGADFIPHLAAAFAAAAPPQEDPARYSGAIQRADAARCRARDDLARAIDRREALLEELERPWLHGLASAADRVLERELRRGQAALDEHVGPTGTVWRVQQRQAWANTVAQLTEAHPNARVTWEEAAAAIAEADGRSASTDYAAAAIQLEPQVGLVPIGMNPVTRLWEFYHLRSAFDPREAADSAEIAIPEHRPDGSIERRSGQGVVFVLLPGSTVVLGAQDEDPNGPNYDPRRRRNEGVQEFEISPFFIARHELTQGQWLRLSLADNPSRRPAGKNVGLRTITLEHPVERVTHRQGGTLLERHGLRFPGELEWEYACRAGTTTPWSSGPNGADLEGYANLFDQTLFRAAGHGDPVDFADGYLYHAPVGSFAPNGFGLFDMHGNVAELCQDRTPGYENEYAVRGGHFFHREFRARSAYRASQESGTPNESTGLRAVRSLF